MNRRKGAFDEAVMEERLKEVFGQIRAEEHLKNSVKQYLNTKRARQTRVFFTPAVRRTLAAACMMLVLVLGFGGYRWSQMPVSYVSIDINPSMELALNRFDRVVSAEAYNPEGEEILKELSLKGKKYNDALDAIVDSDAMKPYLTGDAELVFTVAAEGQREGSLLHGIRHCLQHVGCGSYSVEADIALVSAAHDSGLSLGKYYAYLQLAEYDETVTPDSCRDMSMSQIHGLIDEHQHGSHSEGGGHHGGHTESYESQDPEVDQGTETPADPEGAGDNAQPEEDGECDVDPEQEEGHHGRRRHH